MDATRGRNSVHVKTFSVHCNTRKYIIYVLYIMYVNMCVKAALRWPNTAVGSIRLSTKTGRLRARKALFLVRTRPRARRPIHSVRRTRVV